MRRELITVIYCHACNTTFGKLDEQFRVFVSTPVNVSDTGKAVMRNKVFGRSLMKSPALKKQMAKGVFTDTVMTEMGPLTVPLIAMDRAVLDPFFTRLTKGLLATFYPDLDYFGLRFAVTQLNQFGAQHPTFKAVTSALTADQRGNGIFRFWHGVAQEQRTAGMWIYQFYDAALFMVRHGMEVSNDSIEERIANDH